MSSLATTPAAVPSGRSRTALLGCAQRLPVTLDAACSFALAAALTLLAFVTAGGVDLGPNTWAEITLMLIGLLLAIALLLWGAPGRAWGGATLALFAAVAVLSGVSIAWSVQPDNSWLEANRTLSYLAAFGGAIALARSLPERWPALIGALAFLATLLCAYALLVKVFPAALARGEVIGRIRAPFDYWNATGLVAALGLPACLWAGSRRERGRVLRALSAPAITILASVLVLSYSRSALLAAGAGIGLWFVLVPVRLRAAPMLVLGLAGAAAVVAWALATHPITHDGASLASRLSAGRSFGLVLSLVLLLITASGFVAAFAIDRVTVSAELRGRLGRVLIIALALIPIGAVAVLASSSRGLTGEVSHVWSTLTSPNTAVSDRPSRLVEVANSRPRYWRAGLQVGEHSPLKGVGAGGYATAGLRYTRDHMRVQHAHSYVLETFADFGLVGVALNLALLVAWGLAAARTLAAQARAPGRVAERAGMFTLLCVVVIFGVHSSIDWTWFVPGTAVPALLCAGWLAGRGPLARPIGLARQRLALSSRPLTLAAVVVLSAGTALGAWTVWQPLRAADADAAAVAALGRGDSGAALADTRAASTRNPLAVEPLWERSAIFSSIGNEGAARAELAKAIERQPENPATWSELGFYELRHSQPLDALKALEKALSLDPGSYQILFAIAQARRESGPLG